MLKETVKTITFNNEEVHTIKKAFALIDEFYSLMNSNEIAIFNGETYCMDDIDYVWAFFKNLSNHSSNAITVKMDEE